MINDYIETELKLEISRKVIIKFKRKLEDKAKTVPFAITYSILILSNSLLSVLHSYKELLIRLVALEIIVLPTALLLLILSARIDDEELRVELVVRRVIMLLVVNTPVYSLNITEPLTRRS